MPTFEQNIQNGATGLLGAGSICDESVPVVGAKFVEIPFRVIREGGGCSPNPDSQSNDFHGIPLLAGGFHFWFQDQNSFRCSHRGRILSGISDKVNLLLNDLF